MTTNNKNILNKVDFKTRKPLLVIVGPTASGKTSLSIHLAKAFNAEIVSADSMQIYRGMNIGTAKPDKEEQQGIPHHMLDIIEVGEEYSVAEYARDARQCINDIHSRGKLPILIGGTGLYVQAIVDNIHFADIPSSDALREELRQKAEAEGNQALWNQLAEVDPKLADKLHPNNQGRIIRGIEVYTLTNKPLSQWQYESRQHPSPYEEYMLGLGHKDRAELYARINLRVELMIEHGLLDEVRWFKEQKVSLTARQAIGYKELLGYIDGEESLEQAKERLKQESRRYAKRQLTWMRKEERIHWLYDNQYKTKDNLYQAAENVTVSWLGSS